MTIQQFIIRLTLLAGFLAAIVFAIDTWLCDCYVGSYTWYSLLFLYILTVGVYSLSYFGLKKGNQLFMTTAMGSVMLKLFGSIIFIIIMLALGVENKANFVVAFFVFYFLFTAFEIYCLLHNLRAQNKN